MMKSMWLMDLFWNTAHRFYGGGYCRIARFFELLSFMIGANEISAKCQIGKDTKFYHRGLGCVVQENTIIGENCRIFQNVTLGSRWKNGVCESGSPIIGDNVVIGAGAMVLGNILIGNNVKIGANAVVTKNIPDEATAVGVPAKIILKNKLDGGANQCTI